MTIRRFVTILILFLFFCFNIFYFPKTSKKVFKPFSFTFENSSNSFLDIWWRENRNFSLKEYLIVFIIQTTYLESLKALLGTLKNEIENFYNFDKTSKHKFYILINDHGDLHAMDSIKSKYNSKDIFFSSKKYFAFF